MTVDELVERLRGIVGGEHVLRGADLEEYSHDSTFLETMPSAAVFPGSTDEVAAVARLCSETRTPLTTRGAGSGLVGGPVPLASGVVLSTHRLQHLEIVGDDLMAVAGAGVVTGQLDEAAGRQGLMYPPDPSSVAISTIGGNVACNSGGLRCLKYGVTADYVTGMTVVLADGQILRLGGPLRKRSSGYRMQALFIGSEGTLGIVTEVVLKLIPRPQHRATAMVSFDSIADAAQAVRRLLQGGYLPAALELMNREALRLVADLLPPGLSAEHGAVLLLEQDGSDGEHVLFELAEMVDLLGGVDNRVAQSEAEREGIWKARRSFGQVVRAERKHVFGEDVAVPISQIPEMARRLEALSREHGIALPTVAHAGDGNLHPNLLFREDQRHQVGTLAARIFHDAIELGGTISAEHGLGALKRDFAILEHGPETIGWWRRLKDLFDPRGILNPHKVLPEQAADERFLDNQPGWGKTLASGVDRTEAAE
jgi:glycolate oxidase